jgi:amidohydrolase
MATYSDIRSAAFARERETREFREDMARHPELAWEEHRATEKIAAEVSALGLRPVIGSRGTGVVTEFGPKGAPLVVISADIDALPLQDKRRVKYRSKTDGKHHGCGHDVATAGLVGAAHVLKAMHDNGKLENRVRLGWRPAEEAGSGAPVMIREDGVLDKADAAFGMHCWPTIRVGKYGVRQGTTQYSAHRVELELTGRGGHTARPEDTEDLVLLQARLVAGMSDGLTEIYRERPEGERPVFTFGASNAGTAMNVIPDHGEALGTLRSPTMKTYRNAPEELRKIAEEITDRYGYDGLKLNLVDLLPPVINTAEPEVRAVLGAMVGAKNIVEFEGSRGGDDFAYFGAGLPAAEGMPAIPGARIVHYTQLGVVPKGVRLSDHPKLHTPYFDVDPRAPAYATAQFAALAATPIRPRAREGERMLLLAR